AVYFMAFGDLTIACLTVQVALDNCQPELLRVPIHENTPKVGVQLLGCSSNLPAFLFVIATTVKLRLP
ncbi:hypothetical protein AB4Z27_14505, partial [Cupriavidus sp. KB_39]